jgi:rhodanese-related sulfurtransferase
MTEERDENGMLLTQAERIKNLLLKAEGFERFLNSDRAQVVDIIAPEEYEAFRMPGTIYSRPKPRINIGGQPIEHHHWELRELIKELRIELDTVNKMSNITVEQARRQLLIDLRGTKCPSQTSTEAKSL